MKILKGFALTILGFLLFLSLTVFGIGLTLKYTVLKPDFVVSHINKIEISSLSQEMLSGNGGFPKELRNSINQTITDLEPEIKNQLGLAIHSIYDYLLGKKPNPELADTLRRTVLSPQFLAALIDKISIADLVNGVIQQQFSQVPADIPPEVFQVIKDNIGPAIAKSEPQLKTQLKSAIVPLTDYLFGKTRSFTVTLDMEPIVKNLKDDVKTALLKSPPPLLAVIPPAERGAYIDRFFAEFGGQIPTKVTLDEAIVGVEAPTRIAEGIYEAEAGLVKARTYVGQFQTYYNLLIVFILLLIIAIIFIHRQVKGATRGLGTAFLVYGIPEFVGIIFLKKFVLPQLPTADMPGNLGAVLSGFASDMMKPLQVFTLALIVLGAILVVISFIYRARPPASAALPAENP